MCIPLSPRTVASVSCPPLADTGLYEEAGLQMRQYFSHFGTDNVWLANPKMPPVKSWCYSLSFAFRKQVVDPVVVLCLL